MWDRFLKVFTCMPASLNVWHKVSLTQMECTCVCQTTSLGGQGPLGVPLIPFLNPPFLPPVRPQPKSQPMITEMEQRWTSGVNGVILNSALNISFAPLSSPYEIENSLPASPHSHKNSIQYCECEQPQIYFDDLPKRRGGLKCVTWQSGGIRLIEVFPGTDVDTFTHDSLQLSKNESVPQTIPYWNNWSSWAG